jgi:23S rRNA pseudouridine1911/1915/1917 synthase
MNGQFFYHPSWPVFYQDNHLLALYKPAGLLVQSDITEEESLLDLGKSWLKALHGKPGRVFLGLVHRLDRPVAGVVLFCRTSKAAGRISEQFRFGSVRKKYIAILEGVPARKTGRLENLILRRERLSSIVVPEGTPGAREARLSFKLLDTDGAGARSLVEIELETGRRHQIRLQFAHIGHPVLGDLRYGAAMPLPQKQIALFACELTVRHPTRNEEVRIRSALPLAWPWRALQPGPSSPPWNWTDLRPAVLPGLTSSE